MERKDDWNADPPTNDSEYDDGVFHPELAKLLPVLYPGAFPNLQALVNSGKPRADLAACLERLLVEAARGESYFKVYRQFKMYNDPTLNPAIYYNRLNDFGSVSPGRIADLVLLRRNPLDDIRNTQAIAGVVVDGRYLSATELDELRGQLKRIAATR